MILLCTRSLSIHISAGTGDTFRQSRAQNEAFVLGVVVGEFHEVSEGRKDMDWAFQMSNLLERLVKVQLESSRSVLLLIVSDDKMLNLGAFPDGENVSLTEVRDQERRLSHAVRHQNSFRRLRIDVDEEPGLCLVDVLHPNLRQLLGTSRSERLRGRLGSLCDQLDSSVLLELHRHQVAVVVVRRQFARRRCVSKVHFDKVRLELSGFLGDDEVSSRQTTVLFVTGTFAR